MRGVLVASMVAVLLSAVGSLPAAAQETTILVDGSTTVGPVAKAFAEYYMALHKNVNITVSESGSGNGAKGLINETCAVADMSRFMKESEFQAAAEKGIMPVAQVIAMDGVAVVVHPSNPVGAISLDQLREVYTGKVGNWKELGGPDKAIVVVSRDTNSGTYETFENLALHGEKMTEAVQYAGSNGAIRQTVQSTPAAIGYVGLGFADETVKALTVNGVAPSRETVASGQYPLTRPLFMFTNGYPKLGSDLHAFVTLYLTRKGQEIIESTGFVPVTNY